MENMIKSAFSYFFSLFKKKQKLAPPTPIKISYILETVTITPEHFKEAISRRKSGERYCDPVLLALKKKFPNDNITIDIDPIMGDDYYIEFNNYTIAIPNYIQLIIKMFDWCIDSCSIPPNNINFNVKLRMDNQI